ncbi:MULTISPECIES: TlpA family protein disulfide reductase [Olivibacter]|uniref:TlpA family protein disulfide reductase n=1 Tax=Olivibacter jilunii TaxID=985016 RepID=A0ABW6B836_9SPHI|nr:TlpA family protein disulfide reductase [Olivibacter sp. UJ_SKK_5.1]MDX3916708.1 TlpA disulfide reductase family protein [Pseudosphingobacterium sp.]
MKYMFLFLISFLRAFSYAQDQQEWLVKIGDKAPDFSFTLADSSLKNLQDYKGKVVLINFFATWCPPCRKELPRVQKEIYDRYKTNKKFELFVFGREENWDKLRPFIEKTGYTFPILPDVKREIFSKYANSGIPRNVVVDEEGKIIYLSLGYTEEEFDKLLEVLDKRLN